MANRYVYEIKRDTRGRVAPEGEWFISHTYIPYLGIICVTEECNYVLGDSVRGPVQLSVVFLPLSVLFRDSMTAVNYGWTLSASCWIESQQERTLEGW